MSTAFCLTRKRTVDGMKRKSGRKRKFIKKYYLFSASLILVSFMIFGIMLLVMITNHWWNEEMDNLIENSKAIASDYIETMENKDNIYDIIILGNDIYAISNATQADYFICDNGGKIIACKEFMDNEGKVCKEHSEIHIREKLIKRVQEDGRLTSFTSVDDEDSMDSFVVAIPIEHNGNIIGEVFAVEDAVGGLLPYVMSVTKMMLVSTVIAVFIAFIAIYLNTRKTAKPIADMIEATDRYAKGDFTYHVKVEGVTREMAEMGNALNRMVDELAIDDEARRSFVANVSHELKTPMTTIGGFVDGILDGTIPPEKQTEYLKTVSNEVKRLARLVVSMLNLSKMELGEISLKPIKYNLSGQIVENLLSMEQRIEEKNLSIEGLEDIADIMVYADKDLLHQVFYNLLDNAMKFTPENGTISFFVEEDDEMTTVKIRNTGPGLTKDQIARIFERFYKVDQSRSFDVKGVGLGLYIVKTIINMHEGTIYAESEENKYTQFTFTIPKKS